MNNGFSPVRKRKLTKQQIHLRKLETAGDGYLEVCEILQALSNPVRLLILFELLNGERNVTYLSTELGIEQPSISRHLQTLRGTRIVKRRSLRNEAYYSITPASIKLLMNFLTRFSNSVEI
jgi:DNA-binding transcriptional ArsR family regulator